MSASVSRIKKAYGLAPDQLIQFVEDETGEYLFRILRKDTQEACGYLRRCEGFFNFFNPGGQVVLSEKADELINAVAALSSTQASEETMNAVRAAYGTTGALAIFPDQSKGYMYRVEKKKRPGAAIGWITKNKALMCFYDLNAKLVLKVPQHKLASLVFGSRDALAEIRMLYGASEDSILLVPNERSQESPWSMRVLANRDDRKHLGYAHLKEDIYYFYAITGTLLRAFPKADMPPSVSGWDFPVLPADDNLFHEPEQEVVERVHVAAPADNVAAAAPAPSSNLAEWSVDDVCSHFQNLGMSDVSSIRSEVINGTALLSLTEADLKEIGVPMGIRKNHALWMQTAFN